MKAETEKKIEWGVFWFLCLGLLLSFFTGCTDVERDFCEGQCTRPNVPATEKIVQGEVSTDRRGTVLVINKGSGYCSGTIIGPHTVLTAAHCIGNGYRIYVNGVGLDSVYDTQHPDYIRFPLNDLRLVYFTQLLPEPYIEIYNPANTLVCDDMLAQGHGVNEDGTQPELREKSYKVIDWRSKTLVTTSCAEDGTTCNGDSGGPLYVRVGGVWQLAGVTSTGYPSCERRSTHVNAHYYRDWIEAGIQ